ncbi:MAG: CoA ester lyase [Deltaproteobacteria bacterium]|nr:CoA ester lyase [Deltaproteobacteria bacterium]
MNSIRSDEGPRANLPLSRNGAALRRSLLFVPGGEPRKLARAASAGADTLVFDLEDSVDLAAKEPARALVAERLAAGTGDSECVVRINGCGTPYFERDVFEVVRAGARSLMLPKSSQATLSHARLHLASVEQRLSLEAGCVRLLALVENAKGIAGLPRLLNETTRLDALCFGNADFSLDMGLADSNLSAGVVYHARCSLAITAAAAGVAAIDGVCLAIRDDDAFECEARAALSLGFTGKLCIHPAQVAVANDVFTPTSEQIARARRVVNASAAAKQKGRGVFALDGRMVDAPVLELQQRLLERARRAGALDAGGGEAHRGDWIRPSRETSIGEPPCPKRSTRGHPSRSTAPTSRTS